MTASVAKEVAHKLLTASSIVVLTGAGMSEESGVPTFRGARHALWSEFDPTQLASLDGWTEDPAPGLGLV